MTDITKFATVAAGVLHLKDAAGELMYADEARELPMRVRLHGPGSKAASTVEGRQTKRAVDRMEDGKFIAPDPETARKEAAEDHATMTIGMENISHPSVPNAQGEELYLAVYADPNLSFIGAQVRKFLGNAGNFKPGSSKN